MDLFLHVRMANLNYEKVVDTRLKRLLKKAVIEKTITPHSFRHTNTSLLIEAGVGIKEIQQRLGHRY